MSLLPNLDDLRGARVLTVGDLMLDEYVWGEVSRVSPEAPVPIVQVSRRTAQPGGAGNVAGGVAALDATSTVTGIVGDDAAGERLRAVLEERGISCSGIVVEPGRSTTVKTRVIAHNQQVVRIDVEDRTEPTPETTGRLAEAVRASVADADVVVISDYAKGAVAASVARGAIEAAREHAKPVVVDPKGRNYSKYRGATIVKPNVPDAERAANILVEDEDDLFEAARRLTDILDGADVLITRGPEGMLLQPHEGEAVAIAADTHEIYDVTGAGDTVTAVLAVALARGAGLEPAVRLANLAAGIAVGRVGATCVTLAEIRAKAGESAA